MSKSVFKLRAQLYLSIDLAELTFFKDPEVEVPIRKTFSDFSTDPEMVANLERLYSHPDEVDLVVGCQLDEEFFPGTTVPKSALIISLFSLFGMGNSDRFNTGFSVMRCLLVDKPWDCKPSNALDALLWKSDPKPGFPNFRTLEDFWMKELDLQAHGSNLLWRLITENSDIDCLQKDPLWPLNPETNPLMCSLPEDRFDLLGTLVTGVQVVLAWIRLHAAKIILTGISAWITWVVYKKLKDSKYPPVLPGWPIIGRALDMQKDPKGLMLGGIAKYGGKVFGIPLPQLTHYVLTDPKDLELIRSDSKYEVKFSLHDFLALVNFGLITQKENFDSDIHTKLIRMHLGNPETLKHFARSIDEAAQMFLDRNPMEARYDSLNNYIDRYIVFVVSYCMVGPEGFDDPQLLETLRGFNDHANNAMGMSALLPSFLQWVAGMPIKKDFKQVRKALVPVIQKMRDQKDRRPGTFLPFILDAVADDDRASG